MLVSQQDIEIDHQGIDYAALEQAAGSGDLIMNGV